MDTLVVDKTGTLTEGHPRVVQITTMPGGDYRRRTAAPPGQVERASEHPLAAAVVAAAQQRRLALAPVSGFDSPAGKGVPGTVDGVALASGSARFMQEQGVDGGAAGRRRRPPGARNRPA